MRTRDIKHRLDTSYMAKSCGTPAQRAEAQAVEKQLKFMLRIRRKQAKQQAAALANPDLPPLPSPRGGCKRGRKPNPFLVKCEAGWHTQLTLRESSDLDALRLLETPVPTSSAFLRQIVCAVVSARAGNPSKSLAVMDAGERQQEALAARHGPPRRLAA